MLTTYKFRLYASKKNKRLHRTIDTAGRIWNHCVALQRRYYQLSGKYINQYALKGHIAKLRNRPAYASWRLVGSQAVQEIIERLDKGYQRFFAYKAGKTAQHAERPGFKKARKYKSFTLKQAGWKLLGDNRIRIGDTIYKYAKSREIAGRIKTVTVKRDNLEHLWLCFAVENGQAPEPAASGNIVGMDFGLKTFLTLSDTCPTAWRSAGGTATPALRRTQCGASVESPQFYRAALSKIRRLNRELARKMRGSHNRRKAKLRLAQAHADLANRRQDWFFKLAHDLTDRYDVLCLEDLNLKGMQRLWGRKVSDLGFASFVGVLSHVAAKKGKRVQFVSRWFPSSKTCSDCGAIYDALTLADRTWVCSQCGALHDRDHNAAINIAREGALPPTAASLGLGGVRPASAGIPCLSLESQPL